MQLQVNPNHNFLLLFTIVLWTVLFDGAIEDFEGNHRQKKKKQVPADSHKYQTNRYLVSWDNFLLEDNDSLRNSPFPCPLVWHPRWWLVPVEMPWSCCAVPWKPNTKRAEGRGAPRIAAPQNGEMKRVSFLVVMAGFQDSQ